MECPHCKSKDIQILSILRIGKRCKCKTCEEIFVEWNKGVDYRGNYEFNKWYTEDNKAELYNVAKKVVDDISDILSEKDWSDDFKIIAFNIIIENIRLKCYGELGLKEIEEELCYKLNYKGWDYNYQKMKKRY